MVLSQAAQKSSTFDLATLWLWYVLVQLECPIQANFFARVTETLRNCRKNILHVWALLREKVPFMDIQLNCNNYFNLKSSLHTVFQFQEDELPSVGCSIVRTKQSAAAFKDILSLAHRTCNLQLAMLFDRDYVDSSKVFQSISSAQSVTLSTDGVQARLSIRNITVTDFSFQVVC